MRAWRTSLAGVRSSSDGRESSSSASCDARGIIEIADSERKRRTIVKSQSQVQDRSLIQANEA